MTQNRVKYFLRVIDAHQVQDRGLDVVHRDAIRHHVVAEVVGLSERGPRVLPPAAIHMRSSAGDDRGRNSWR